MEVAREALRWQEAFWCSSMRAGFPHLHEEAEGSGSEGREGLRRQGPEEPRPKNTTLIASITLEGGMGEAM